MSSIKNIDALDAASIGLPIDEFRFIRNYVLGWIAHSVPPEEFTRALQHAVRELERRREASAALRAELEPEEQQQGS